MTEYDETSEFTPLECEWCYWEPNVTTDEMCVCLHDACRRGDPTLAFGLACDGNGNEGECPCEYFEEA